MYRTNNLVCQPKFDWETTLAAYLQPTHIVTWNSCASKLDSSAGMISNQQVAT
jgi:hypothetical protein